MTSPLARVIGYLQRPNTRSFGLSIASVVKVFISIFRKFAQIWIVLSKDPTLCVVLTRLP